jgi:hypothetical protein
MSIPSEKATQTTKYYIREICSQIITWGESNYRAIISIYRVERSFLRELASQAQLLLGEPSCGQVGSHSFHTNANHSPAHPVLFSTQPIIINNLRKIDKHYVNFMPFVLTKLR